MISFASKNKDNDGVSKLNLALGGDAPLSSRSGQMSARNSARGSARGFDLDAVGNDYMANRRDSLSGYDNRMSLHSRMNQMNQEHMSLREAQDVNSHY